MTEVVKPDAPPYGYRQGYAAETENTSIVSPDNRSRQEIRRNSIRRGRKEAKEQKEAVAISHRKVEHALLWNPPSACPHVSIGHVCAVR